MIAFKNSRLFFLYFFIFLSGGLLADPEVPIKEHEISLNYLGVEGIRVAIDVTCSEEDKICQSKLEFKGDDGAQESGAVLPSIGPQLQGLFHRHLNDSSELVTIVAQKENRQTEAHLRIDYEGLKLGNKDSPLIRALIAQIHPAVINVIEKDLSNTTEVVEYVTGRVKNSETLHLFRPEKHSLSLDEDMSSKDVADGESLVLDIGDSYSMVLIFSQDNVLESIDVLDRSRVHRNPAYKTVIGFGDLAGLVLHGVELVGYLGNIAAGGMHLIGNAGNAIHVFLHGVEIIDHSSLVGKYLGGGQKHYQDHDHGVIGNLLGIIHLVHACHEMREATASSLHARRIQLGLTFAGFMYHHLPDIIHSLHEYWPSMPNSPYERSISDVLSEKTDFKKDEL